MKKLVCALLVFSSIANFLLLYNIFIHPGESLNADIGQESLEQMPYLSPRIFMYNQNDLIIRFVPLRQKLIDYQKEKGDNFGIYFEYLPSGTSIGVNEKKEFVAASLLKLPLILAVYKRVEEGSLSLDQELTIQAQDLDPYSGDLWKKGEGAKLTVQEAIRYTLTISDNTAKNMLFRAIPEGSLEDVFDSLDIPKELIVNDVVVSPKNYSSVLRSLYLSSYLTKVWSNQVLDLMTQSPFKDKLQAGVPQSVVVAHKIGIFDPQNPKASTYTDCGIVYVPKRPYVLCMMAKTDEASARLWMSEVSKFVYEFVSTSNSSKSK